MENPEIKSLKDLQGTVINIILPGLDKTKIQQAMLHRVETSGLWLEVQEMTNDVLRAIGQPSSSTTPIFFVPWHGVTMILRSVEKISLSERSFGV